MTTKFSKGIFSAPHKRVKQSFAQPNVGKDTPLRDQHDDFFVYSSKLLRSVRQALTTGRRLTKFGQVLLVIFQIDDILKVTANLGYLLFSRRSTRPPPSLLDHPASWIDGAKEMQ
jgi:hypothetical protein